MTFSTLHADQRLDTADGAVVVVIPVYGGHDLFTQCLRSVLLHTPEDVPILVADDGTPDDASRRWVEGLQEAGQLRHAISWSRAEENGGFVVNCNRAFAQAGRADVILLNSDCVVSAGWVEGLRGAVARDGSIATATTLTNHGSIVSVPVRNTPLQAFPQHLRLDTAAAAVRAASRRLYPRLPTAIGHCVLIRRAALDLVGGFDEAFSPGYGEEVDFSQRCLGMGLQHVLADDVLVFHRGGGSFDYVERTKIALAHDVLVDHRYPDYRGAVAEAESDPANTLARALAVASQAMLGTRVTVDVRCLGRHLAGTQVHALELVHALWRTGQVQLRLLIPNHLGAYAQPIIDSMTGVEAFRASEITPTTRRDPLVHRPFQVSSLEDVELLERLGERLVVTHQDLISYRNPTYFASTREWTRFKDLTAETLASSAMTVFFSRHAADDALAETLVPEDRVRVAHLGVDHQLEELRVTATAPPFAERLAGAPFLLCVGTDFRHKNRLFALKLLQALRRDHGWAGRLVLCGARALNGSSAGAEAAFLAEHPDLEEVVVDGGAVDEAQKQWLLERTAAVLYPSTYEGFGLVPFEAAAAGVPCLFAWVSSLAELLPPESATLVPWDVDRSAAAIRPLLEDGPARTAHVEGLRAAAEPLTWARTAETMLEAYRETLALPDRDIHRVYERQVPDARYWLMRSRIGDAGLALVAAEEPLLPEPAQRTLAALARRRVTRGPLLALLRLLSVVGGRTPVPPPPAVEPSLSDEPRAGRRVKQVEA